MTQDAALLGHLDRLEGSTRAIGKLVQFTRDFKDLGMHPPRWFGIEDCIRDSTRGLEPSGITISFDGGPWEIYADPQITRAFSNIVENTRIHGKNATAIRMDCGPRGRELSLVIEDNGAGIPGEMKKEIFEPGMIRNRGFGLFLAREILSITGLTIEENGTAGKGARFEIRIPPESFRMPKVTAGAKSHSLPEVEP